MFGNKKDESKMDLWRIKKQIISDGYALLLTDKNVFPLKLMYVSDDVLKDGALVIDKILEKYGNPVPDMHRFDGYIITGEVKGRHLYAEKVLDFKEINGLK
jgi:hypothetical protein